MTPDQKRILRQWSGLKDVVLDQLSRLDTDAIARGDRFSVQRAEHIESRERTKALRASLGVDHFGRDPPPPLQRDYSNVNKDPY